MTKTIALRLEVPADDEISVTVAQAEIKRLLRRQGALAIGDAGPENLAGEMPMLFLQAADVKQGSLREERGVARRRKANGGGDDPK